MPYPHGRACRCPPLPPDAGLLAYTVDCDHYEQMERALAKIATKPSTATLRVLTTDPEPPANLVRLPSDPEPCTGEMTCPCLRCSDERAARVRRGVRRSSPIPIRIVKKAA